MGDADDGFSLQDPLVAQLGRVSSQLCRRGQPQKALSCLQRAFASLEAARPEEQPRLVLDRARTLLALCAVLSQLGKHVEAFLRGFEALEDAQAIYAQPALPAELRGEVEGCMSMAQHCIALESEFLGGIVPQTQALKEFRHSVLCQVHDESIPSASDHGVQGTLDEGAGAVLKEMSSPASQHRNSSGVQASPTSSISPTDVLQKALSNFELITQRYRQDPNSSSTHDPHSTPLLSSDQSHKAPGGVSKPLKVIRGGLSPGMSVMMGRQTLHAKRAKSIVIRKKNTVTEGNSPRSASGETDAHTRPATDGGRRSEPDLGLKELQRSKSQGSMGASGSHTSLSRHRHRGVNTNNPFAAWEEEMRNRSSVCNTEASVRSCQDQMRRRKRLLRLDIGERDADWLYDNRVMYCDAGHKLETQKPGNARLAAMAEETKQLILRPASQPRTEDTNKLKRSASSSKNGAGGAKKADMMNLSSQLNQSCFGVLQQVDTSITRKQSEHDIAANIKERFAGLRQKVRKAHDSRDSLDRQGTPQSGDDVSRFARLLRPGGENEEDDSQRKEEAESAGILSRKKMSRLSGRHLDKVFESAGFAK